MAITKSIDSVEGRWKAQ